MHTTEQPSTELKIATAQIVTDPAILRLKLGRIYRLILDYSCWKQAAAQAGIQERHCEAAPHAS